MGVLMLAEERMDARMDGLMAETIQQGLQETSPVVDTNRVGKERGGKRQKLLQKVFQTSYFRLRLIISFTFLFVAVPTVPA